MKVKLLSKLRYKSRKRYQLASYGYMYCINYIGWCGVKSLMMEQDKQLAWYSVNYNKAFDEVQRLRRDWVARKVTSMKMIRNAFALS